MTDREHIPWRQRDSHKDLVLELRVLRRENKGADRGVLTQQIRVRHRDGRILLDREVTLHWRHFGQIDAAFSDLGDAVVVTSSDGRDRIWTLD